MSTEHQRYSTENQSDVLHQYADARGMDIVQTYADEGKRGLNVAGRDALRQLIADVESGAANFDSILVYDVSRWGRFQDADESAYYGYLCKRANIGVHYCAEPFVNDGSLSSTLLKTIKRGMAGEYSRDLSVKVFAGQCRLIELGFRQGGPPGYGLRRLLIDQHRNTKTILARGDRTSLQTDRVVLVPGPKDEIAIAQEIYRRFTEDRRPICWRPRRELLNRRKAPCAEIATGAGNRHSASRIQGGRGVLRCGCTRLERVLWLFESPSQQRARVAIPH
jgi:DNA invertase Pin-like site-specific DNA recombinase